MLLNELITQALHRLDPRSLSSVQHCSAANLAAAAHYVMPPRARPSRPNVILFVMLRLLVVAAAPTTLGTPTPGGGRRGPAEADVWLDMAAPLGLGRIHVALYDNASASYQSH
jgi:hypothetical protein